MGSSAKAPVSHTYRRVISKLLYALQLDQKLRHWDDERYLKLLYRLRTGKRLRLDHPETFSEKMQWLKLNDRRPLYGTLVDKYEVKKWVAGRVGASYVVPNLGVWESFDEIDFEELPAQFVLKCTHDSGGLAICADRSAFDIHAARGKIERSLSRNYYALGREWPYRDVNPRILAEVYLPTWTPDGPEVSNPRDDGSRSAPTGSFAGVIDYKFYCFHGVPRFLYVSQGLHDHQSARMVFLSCDWTPTGFSRPDYLAFQVIPPKPKKFDEMLTISRVLSAGIPFVRVDLFERQGRVLFSEMTFHPVSGMMPLEPKSADLEIGQYLDLSLVEVSR